MKRALVLSLIGSLCLGAIWAAYRAVVPESSALQRYVPSGALLYLQANDFASLLADWNASPRKQSWVKSGNYQVFSQSRLFLRLRGASEEFTKAAGLPPDMNFLTQVAGTQSALALYDIGKLQFLYITKLPSANSMQSALWQTRAKFQPRSAGGVTFYLRRDPESGREVAFAVNGDFLLLATREDLLAGALQLMGGGKDFSIEAEPWWTQSVAAAGPAGDLRMVLNLDKLVPSPYFRSYWIQKNITDMKQYSAAVTDLYRSGNEYREERVLLKKAAPGAEASPSVDGAASVADLVRLVPAETGIYEVRANPSADLSLALLQTKILAPHLGPAPAQKLAPQVQLASGQTGDSSDLETRIDLAPVRGSGASDAAVPLKNLLQTNRLRAILQVQVTEQDKEGVFVRIHSGVALLGDTDWNEASARSAFADFVRPALTAGNLGVDWQAQSGYQELDGLWTFAAAVRGKYLLVSDDSALLAAMVANLNRKAVEKPAAFLAGFNHARESGNFVRFTGLLDRRNLGARGSSQDGQSPQFFSDNVGSLSSTLSGVSSQKIVVRDAGDKIFQTVTYEWSH
ncbi:MAG TPA: hypothetical protein VHE23_04820 [Candidatus Acidoferrales bacterium]|nr:hypothetical protein [Candidatus Acidoferrales bacterium]